MIILGIESTAHTLGISVIDREKILSNDKVSFSTEEGGMKPYDVAEHHLENLYSLFKKSLDNASISARDVDLISFSQSPGIGNMLKVGVLFARSLHLILRKPVVGVNHCIAHLEIGRKMSGCDDPIFLYASGANTQIIAYEGKRYRIFGETLDMGIGNFLDSFARYAGLGFPGGPKIYELSLLAKRFIELPYLVKGMDTSFGGILTNLKNKLDSGTYSLEDLCFSSQEVVFAQLIEICERAMAHCGKKELLLGGGVACNKRLQEMARVMCEERDAKSFVIENQFNVDNAAMIAWLGFLMYCSDPSSVLKFEDIVSKPYLRTDQVQISWRE